MKFIKFNLILLICGFIFSANNVYAGCDGFYLAARGGFTDFEVDSNQSGMSRFLVNHTVDKKKIIASSALGYRHKHFRTEAEYVWRRDNRVNFVNIGQMKFKSRSYMFVVYYDFFPYTWFTPYVNAGIGYTETKMRFFRPQNPSLQRFKVKDGEFTWSLGAGISAKLTNRFNLDLGYRYYDMGDINEPTGKSDMTNQEVYLGLRYVL